MNQNFLSLKLSNPVNMSTVPRINDKKLYIQDPQDLVIFKKEGFLALAMI